MLGEIFVRSYGAYPFDKGEIRRYAGAPKDFADLDKLIDECIGEIKEASLGKVCYRELPITFDYKENSRALGLADMAKALRTGRGFRANVDMTYHVLEVMESFTKSSEEKRWVEIQSRFDKTPIMNRSCVHGVLDEY